MSVRIPTSLTTNLNLIAAMLLDCGRLLTIKMMYFHTFFCLHEVVDLDLSFQTLLKSVNFNICSSSYGQISEQRLDLDKTTVLTS